MSEYGRDNLAYDLSVYEPKPEAEAKPRITVKRNPNPIKIKRPKSAFRAFINATIAFMLLCSILYGKVESNRLFREQSELQTQLTELKNENLRMQTEYDSKTSIQRVEDYAENILGLEKLDKAQIEYVEVPNDTVIKSASTSDNNIFVKIKNWVMDALEYIGA